MGVGKRGEGEVISLPLNCSLLSHCNYNYHLNHTHYYTILCYDNTERKRITIVTDCVVISCVGWVGGYVGVVRV